MDEATALSQMIFPRQRRPLSPAFQGGVIQIWVTRSCDKSCYNCTQGSNLAGRTPPITVEQFEEACKSLKDYFGVVGVFGGNPATHSKFSELCEILSQYIPFERRGLWCNKLFGQGAIARKTFNPAVSNLNVHLDKEAYEEFKRDWPESNPFGLTNDSRHAPPYVAMKDVLKKTCPSCGGTGRGKAKDDYGRKLIDGDYGCPDCHGNKEVYDVERAWELIAGCDINQRWSAMIGVFRGELRGWFCEIAGAQAILHQHEKDYPDTGLAIPGSYVQDDLTTHCPWWQAVPTAFSNQVRKHCHECGVPLRGYGVLSQGEEKAIESVSKTHEGIYNPKSLLRNVELVTELSQVRQGRIEKVVDYLGNAKR